MHEDDITVLKEAFAMIDINHDGNIDVNELQQLMRKLGQNPCRRDVLQMIRAVDGDDQINFDEFLMLMQSRISSNSSGSRRRGDPDKELRDAFAIFDVDGNGTIDRQELNRLMEKFGHVLTEEELDSVMKDVDTNGDGVISFEEFKEMMT